VTADTTLWAEDALPPRIVTYRHASGDDADGCSACVLDAVLEGLTPPDDIQGCTEPTPDPDEPEVCLVCSHTVEARP
jgi:hypothetical protein